MSRLTPGKEYERRFLVLPKLFPADLKKNLQAIRQGYLSMVPAQVRVRVVNGAKAVLEIKGRDDDEFSPMPLLVEDAEKLLRKYRVGSLISKQRYEAPSAFDGLTWEIDFFLGRNASLVVAEIETPAKRYDLDPKLFPKWIGPEITGDPWLENLLKNRALAMRPFDKLPRAWRKKILKMMEG